MDQFIQQRYTDEINVDTGEKIVDWVRFEEIKPLFDKAMRLGTPEVPQEWVHDAEEYFRRLEEQERQEALRREREMIPNFIQDIKNALQVEIQQKDTYREICPYSFMGR